MTTVRGRLLTQAGESGPEAKDADMIVTRLLLRRRQSG